MLNRKPSHPFTEFKPLLVAGLVHAVFILLALSGFFGWLFKFLN